MPNSEPLTPSMKLPERVIPTTCTSESATGTGDGMNTEFIGLSATPCPTMGWSTSTWMPFASRCACGPTPLSISSCGLPSVPAARITSFLPPSCRYTRCCTPSGSANTTPYATGYGAPSVIGANSFSPADRTDRACVSAATHSYTVLHAYPAA